MKITIFPGKYHQNGGCSMAMLVYRSVKKYNLMFDVQYSDISLNFQNLNHFMKSAPCPGVPPETFHPCHVNGLILLDARQETLLNVSMPAASVA